ncbi:hypothetical protein SRABI121_01229 [Microbacterium sp. Bi121]|nr:hypothetical protein SRABI121_01229 [Microbacterium sp. Bi121]
MDGLELHICQYGVMPRVAKPATVLAALALAVTALTGCSAVDAPTADPAPTSTADPTPTPTYLTELPDWAKEGHALWLIYPDGFKCGGTEGCPNDYRALIGEPGPVLPEGVEYYDSAKHDCVVVAPLGVDCFTGSKG